MAIGPQDNLDELLVQKYAQKQVNDPKKPESTIDPDKIMLSMNNYALVGRCMAAVNKRILAVSYSLNVENALHSSYRKAFV